MGDFSRGGLFWLLRERYETSQERGRVFERLMQYAFRRHPDVYGPARFKNVWRWMARLGSRTCGGGWSGRIGKRMDTSVMWESTS